MSIALPQMMGQSSGWLPNIHYVVTLCHFAISGALHSFAPGVFAPPAMLGIGSGNVPYTRMVWARHRDSAIALALAVALIAGVAEVVSWLCM